MKKLVSIFFCIIFTASCEMKNNKTEMENRMICNTLEQLEKNEGKSVEIHGTFMHPGKTRLGQLKVILEDGNAVVLNTGDEEFTIFTEENNSKKIMLVAKFYDKNIPEQYGMEGRTNQPVILDIEKAELLQ